MKLYDALPRELLGGWKESQTILAPGTTANFHYHDVEEWLAIVSGEITFFTLAEQPFHLDVGHAFRIPRGEVHRAKAGDEGVEYQMFLPVEAPLVANDLSSGELDALRRNLEFPECEDGRIQNGREFFENALSDCLLFCRASGVCVDKKTFIKEAFVDKGRSSAGSIQVLNKTKNGLLVSTIVNVAGDGGTSSFTNLRFLAVEDGALRCRLWANYPQQEPTQVIA